MKICIRIIIEVDYFNTLRACGCNDCGNLGFLIQEYLYIDVLVSHGGEDVDVGLLGSNAVCTCM
jgi:hypothetical protein